MNLLLFKLLLRRAWLPLLALGVFAALAIVGLFVPAVATFVWGEGGAVVLATAVVAPFPVDPDLQAVAIAYRNQRLIADLVMPRVTVGKQLFKYYLWEKAESFTIPDTRVGRTSRPNQVEFKASERESSTKDYGLDDPIPQADIDNAPAGVDPRARAVEGLMDLILLDREVRVAAKAFSAANYATANKQTLSGSSQFSHADSKPIETLGNALDKPIVRPNKMVIGQEAWTVLRRHPHIVSAAQGNSGERGMASRQAVAELFELDEILVGQAFLNTAKKGQAATFSRVWGKHILLFFQDALANPTASANRVTYAITAQWGPRIAGSQRDPNIGLRGGEVVRVGESVDEHIVAADVAFFLENVTA